ncbi:MAG: hypothetical protein AAF204_00840 [Pseudomonadota bacterium]
MDQRTTYLLQILDTIGSPLMSAITSAASPDSQTDIQGDAKFMAALLGKTVEASIALGEIMDINPAEAQNDTLRVALAGLAGPLVAGQYRRRGKVPESPDIKRMANALQAVLTFSDNFTPTPETVERLKNIQASGQPVDGYQTQIQYMQAFIPVIEAIAAFPFGQAEAKLIMDVSDRLVKKSVELRETLLPGISDEAVQKRAELGLLQALAAVYSACHKAETEKAMAMGEAARTQGLSMDPVWASFDTRSAMLESLAASMVGGEVQNSSATSGGPAPEVSQPPAETPQASAPPSQPPAPPPAAPSEQAATPPPAAEPPAQASQNPMSIFAKPKADGDAPAQPAPPPAEPPAQPPPAEPPPTQTPPEQPPAPPPAAPPEKQPPSDAGGNPMSFFKKGDDE